MHEICIHTLCRQIARRSLHSPSRAFLPVRPVRHFSLGQKFSAKRPVREDQQQEANDEKNVTVSITQQKANRENPYLDEVSPEEGKRLREELAQTRAELAKLEQELQDGSIFEPLIEDMPPDGQALLRAALRKSGEKGQKKAQDFADILPKLLLEPKKADDLPVEGNPAKKLQFLNAAIEPCVRDIQSHQNRSNLWKIYIRCRNLTPGVISLIPEATWGLLLATTATAQMKGDPSWASRRNTIYEDMITTGHKPNTQQSLLHADSLSHVGRHDDAAKLWQEVQAAGTTKAAMPEQVAMIGIAVYTRLGDMAQAEKIALQYLADRPAKESRILIGIITGWLVDDSSAGPESSNKAAWATYLRLKERLGNDMTAEDYDRVSVAFLNAGRTSLALNVFKDMTLMGKRSEEESLMMFREGGNLVNGIHSENIDLKDLTRVVTQSLKYQNKFFFGAWLKKLIGMKELDAALQVLELMHKGNVERDPYHVNGIMGGFLRSESEANEKKAEQMAWTMILARFRFVEARNQRQVKGTPDFVPQHMADAIFKRGFLPKATIETFSLLAFHYVNRNMTAELDLLEQARKACEVAPDRYYMNHHLYYDLRQGNLLSVWNRYAEIFVKIPPDVETFECLWDAEKKHLERQTLRIDDEYPDQRLVLKEMAQWFFTRTPAVQKRAREYFSKDLYRTVVRCMMLAKDFEGLVLAAYFFAEAFHVYPDAETAKVVTLGVARWMMDMGVETAPEWRPARHRIERRAWEKRNKELDNAINKVIQLHEGQYEERRIYLATRGFPNVDINARIRNQESLWIFRTFVCSIIMRVKPEIEDEASMDKILRQAAADMRLERLDLRDPAEAYDKEFASLRKTLGEQEA